MRDEFPVRIIRLRAAQDMSVPRFAASINIDNRHVYSWESGEFRPSFDVLVRIKAATGVSLDWLVAGCGTMFPTVART